MTEEIITTDNNQKMSAYCKTCICKSCEQVARLEQENNSLQAQVNNITVQSNNTITALEQENKELKSALEEIRAILNKKCGIISNAKAVGLINEALNESC